jgi:PPOX class probable F420-dependent enzyme
MGRSLTKEELNEFLHQPYLARLATVQEDGAPYIVPVWHDYDGEALYIVAREKSQYVQHIRREPRVALSILDGAQVLVLGRAEIVEGPVTGGRWVAIAFRMATKYGGEGGITYLRSTLDRPRYLIRVVPDKVISWSGEGWHPRYWESTESKTPNTGAPATNDQDDHPISDL